MFFIVNFKQINNNNKNNNNNIKIICSPKKTQKTFSKNKPTEVVTRKCSVKTVFLKVL